MRTFRQHVLYEYINAYMHAYIHTHMCTYIHKSTYVYLIFRYARRVLGGRADEWCDVTCHEIRAFLAINIVMGINHLPTLEAYWSTNPALGCEWISATMSKNRYMKINRFLHVNNTDSAPARGQPGFDPLLKIRNTTGHLSTFFGSCLKPQIERALCR